MSPSNYIIEVSEADFEFEVIAYSHQVPVVVDFWAEWCGPCRTLGPLLEKLAEEGAGAFRLAKINVDDNPNVALRYNVRSIPAVKAFQDGQVVSDFVGALPEAKVRDFLRALAPSKTDLTLEKAQSYLIRQQAREAEKLFRQVLEGSPSNPAALLGLSKSLLMQGHCAEALQTLKSIPSGKELASVEIMLHLAEALGKASAGEISGDDSMSAAYVNSLHLVARNNIPAAMDGLLDILRQDKRYRNGEARAVMIGILELLGEENPLTRQYRNELASVLF